MRRACPPSRLSALPPAVRMAVAVVLVAAAVSGCGVPAESEPRRIDDPAGLGSSGSTASEAAGSTVLRLYLIRDGRLVWVPRRISARLTTAQQLEDLLAGPTPEEREEGLSSALSGTTVTAVDLSGRRATITLADRAEPVVSRAEVLAFGQIVCTLTSLPEVGTVSFRANGKPLRVPRADGSRADTPLTIADYSSLLG